jgi:hypothetical protein
MTAIDGYFNYVTYHPINYTAYYDNTYPAPTSYRWSLEPYYSNNVITNGTSRTCTVTFGTPGEYVITVTGSNTYGSSLNYHFLTIVPDSNSHISSASLPYPNPVSDILTVPLEQAVTSSMTAASQAVRPAYDIRLYSEFGSIVKQSVSSEEQAELNVADLPDGIYYLHVYAGSNTRPDIHKIIIRH